LEGALYRKSKEGAASMLLRAGFEPRPESEGLVQVELINKICNTLRSKPFSPHSILGFGDFHNALLPNVPNDHNNRGSTLFPKFLEPIHESFPSGLEHIPVAEDNNKVLAEGSKQPVEEGVVEGHGGYGRSNLLMQPLPEQSQPLPTYGVALIQPQQEIS